MKVDFRPFFKSLETIIVFGGILLTFLFGKAWLIPMFIGYTLVKVDNAWGWIKSKFKK